MTFSTAVLLAGLAVSAAASQETCGSFTRPLGGGSIDLAPPPGYVEICSKDAALCDKLTAAYSKSVTTLAYFVPAAEWESHAKTPGTAFQRYLIAQVAPNKTAAQLPEVKSFVRSQQHGAERGKVDEALAADGQARLGVIDDTADSISMGAVAKRGGDKPLFAMTNSAIAVGPDMLSLYVYDHVADTKQIAQVEELTLRWLRCVRDANRRPATAATPKAGG